MTRHVFRARTLAVAAVTLLAGAALAALPSIAAHAATNSFRGVNWADVNDNFADSTVVPSGLSTSDSYATVKAKATVILNDFTANLGTNTVRLPLNPSRARAGGGKGGGRRAGWPPPPRSVRCGRRGWPSRARTRWSTSNR